MSKRRMPADMLMDALRQAVCHNAHADDLAGSVTCSRLAGVLLTVKHRLDRPP